MKSVFFTVLMEVLSFLTSQEFLNLVKQLVLTEEQDKSKAGKEKRDAVIKEIELSGFDFAGHLVNLVVEGVVAQQKEAKH